jgi:predicted outer membrane repeat protein
VLTRGGFGNGSAVNNAVNGDVTLRNVKISESGADAVQGGAIYNAGLLEVELSYFRNNSARNSGGAIYNAPGATASVRNATLLANMARHPILALGDGGAIYNLGTLTVDGSTFYVNDAKRFGGGLYTAQGTASIVNSTFVENRAGTAGSGGGIYASNTAVSTSLVNVTVERNNADIAGGIWNGGNVTLANTIVANSSVTADNGTPSLNCDGPPVTSNGHNLISDGTCVTGANPTDLRNVDPLLSFINVNGGPTSTLLPLVGSPVIDAGGNPLCPAQDQRGVARPVAATCDIGAVEYRLIDNGLGVYMPLVEQ